MMLRVKGRTFQRAIIIQPASPHVAYERTALEHVPLAGRSSRYIARLVLRTYQEIQNWLSR